MEEKELICDICVRDNRSHRIEYCGEYYFTECLGVEDAYYGHRCDGCGYEYYVKNEKLKPKEWIS